MHNPTIASATAAALRASRAPYADFAPALDLSAHALQLSHVLRAPVRLDHAASSPRALVYRIDTGARQPARARVRLLPSGAVRVHCIGIDADAVRAAVTLAV